MLSYPIAVYGCGRPRATKAVDLRAMYDASSAVSKTVHVDQRRNRMLHIEDLGRGELFALMSVHDLDGRRSTYPMSARGFAPFNVFVAVEDDRAVLVDTGYSIDQDQIIRALETIVDDRMLSIWVARIGEFSSICNVRPILDRFTVDRLRGGQGDPSDWVDFRPEFSRTRAVFESVDCGIAKTGDRVPIDLDGYRSLLALPAPLVLLPTNWIYDASTQTLLSGDAFGYVTRETDQGPWTVTDAEATFPEDDFERYHSDGRYWWLPAANTDSIRREISDIFDSYEINRIAPAWGCILEGPSVVARHFERLDQALVEAPEKASVGLATGQVNFGGSR